MKAIIITIFFNIAFFAWIFNGRFSDGDIGMIPFPALSVSFITLAIFSMLRKLFRFGGLTFYFTHFIIFSVTAFLLDRLLGNMDILNFYLFNLLETGITGFINRGYLICLFISYTLTFLAYRFVMK